MNIKMLVATTPDGALIWSAKEIMTVSWTLKRRKLIGKWYVIWRKLCWFFKVDEGVDRGVFCFVSLT